MHTYSVIFSYSMFNLIELDRGSWHKIMKLLSFSVNLKFYLQCTLKSDEVMIYSTALLVEMIVKKKNPEPKLNLG